MNAAEFNGLVAQAARNQDLRGYHYADAGTGAAHHWKVRVGGMQTASDFGINPLTGKPYFSDFVFGEKTSQRRLWKVYVDPGTVNDRMATITYQRTGDPRGWEMPRDYPAAKAAARLYGDKFSSIDRPLTDAIPPYLLVTAPNDEETEPGGFARVADVDRPEFFRTRAMLKLHLYVAYVFVTVAPVRSDPWEVVLQAGGARLRRWQVRAGQLPKIGLGVFGYEHCELARIYLTRKPGKAKEDRCYVQQREFWSLTARPVVNAALLELAAAIAEAAEVGTLGLLAFGATGLAVGAAVLAVESALVGLVLADFAQIVAGVSTLEFWSSA